MSLLECTTKFWSYNRLFKTDLSILTQHRSGMKLSESGKVMYNSDTAIIYDYRELDEYIGKFEHIFLYNLSPYEYNTVRRNYQLHFHYSVSNIVLKMDKHFFKLEGKQRKKIRHVRNHYSNMFNLLVLEEPLLDSDIDDLLNRWKKAGKRRPIPYLTSPDKNFFRKYAAQYKDRLMMRFFYIGVKLVGYSVIERVGDIFFNHLIRKADRSYNHLALFIDYYVYKEIFKELGTVVVVNLSEDGGLPGLYKEKTENFPVYKIFKHKHALINHLNINIQV